MRKKSAIPYVAFIRPQTPSSVEIVLDDESYELSPMHSLDMRQVGEAARINENLANDARSFAIRIQSFQSTFKHCFEKVISLTAHLALHHVLQQAPSQPQNGDSDKLNLYFAYTSGRSSDG